MSLENILGANFTALLRWSEQIEDGIARRKLAQLKAQTRQFEEMPKARFIGVSTFYSSVVALFYMLLLSYISLAVALQGRFAGLFLAGGCLIFTLLIVAMSNVTKGRSLALKLFVVIALLQAGSLLILAIWPLYLSFSLLSAILWVVSVLLLWQARRIMNGEELAKLMRWRIRLRVMHYRRRALTKGK